MSDEDRETMQQELMDLGVWLAEHPEAATKNLKPIRDRVVLDPGIYYNSGTGMIERIYAPQRVALGHRLFRISSDPAAPLEELLPPALFTGLQPDSGSLLQDKGHGTQG